MAEKKSVGSSGSGSRGAGKTAGGKDATAERKSSVGSAKEQVSAKGSSSASSQGGADGVLPADKHVNKLKAVLADAVYERNFGSQHLKQAADTLKLERNLEFRPAHLLPPPTEAELKAIEEAKAAKENAEAEAAAAAAKKKGKGKGKAKAKAGAKK